MTWHQDNKHTDSKMIWIWIRTGWETDDPYDKNPITADGNIITWSWRYECDGDDGDDSDDGADKNTMVTIRTGWWR